MIDLHSKVTATRVIGPVAIGANATKTGVIIDRASGNGYQGVEFIASYGAVTTTGTICTLNMFEGAVTGTMTSVASGDMLGTMALASLLATTPRTSGVSQNVAKRVGYKGNQRYVRVDSISTGVTSAGAVSVTALLHSPFIAPTSNP